MLEKWGRDVDPEIAQAGPVAQRRRQPAGAATDVDQETVPWQALGLDGAAFERADLVEAAADRGFGAGGAAHRQLPPDRAAVRRAESVHTHSPHSDVRQRVVANRLHSRPHARRGTMDRDGAIVEGGT